MAQTELERNRDYIANTINCINIGKITAIDPETQTIDVQIYNKDMLKNAGIEYAGEEVLLTGVPFIIISGGEASIEMPIKAGDDCVVLYNDFKYKNWIDVRRAGVDVSNDKHSRNYPLAIVGARSPFDATLDYSLTDMVMKNGINSIIKIKPESVEITYGENAKIIVKEESVDIEYGVNKIVVSASGINMTNTTSGDDFATSLSELIDAIVNAVDTRGDVFNPATKAAINAAKTKLEGILG